MADFVEPAADAASAETEAADTTVTNTEIPMPRTGAVVARIEGVLGAIVDALHTSNELILNVSRRGSLGSVRFPGRTLDEAKKFARVIFILQLAHDALVSGTVLTKRHIYYQHQELFDTQRQVDDLVDDLAATLGIGRSDLNIVAASKGVLAGAITVRLCNGTLLQPSGDMGVPIPPPQSIASVTLDARWLLVVEKDAVFRSLCAAHFSSGPGLLITGKGYPDLATRAFLQFVHANHPRLPLFALVDFDPDGFKILRCYRHGSERLAHEADACVPGLQWLGIHSGQLCDAALPISSTLSREPVTYLTARERRIAKQAMERCTDARTEWQMLLVLGIRAEIEWLDEAGNLCSWLDRQLHAALGQ